MAVITLQEVYDAAGRRLSLRGAGRSGGEGTVYEIEERPVQLAKIYHPGKRTPEIRTKLEAMRASPPRDAAWDSQRVRSISWVQDILYADPGRKDIVGFTMPRIDTATYKEAHLYFDAQDRVRRFGGGFTWRHLLATATNIASSVAAVHAQGHRIGDLSETNVLVAPDARIALIDCDSFQIRDPKTGTVFHSRVGTADYLPRELLDADFRQDHDRSYADRFALGVLLFKMLMGGTHPYQACGRRVEGLPSTQAKIARGLYPYRGRRGVEPPPFALPYEILPPALRRLFERCFVQGHRRRILRPAPSEWFEALKEAGKHLRVCPANVNHVHGAHLRLCPWCALPEDPFPAPGAPGSRFVVKAAAPPAVAAPAEAARRTRPAIAVKKGRVIAAACLAAVVALLASPVGHGASPERRSAVALSARATGPCPHERDAPVLQGCEARWRFGPATSIRKDSRSWFLMRASTHHIEIRLSARFDARGRECAVPWIEARTFNERGSPVCLAPCADRIEMRSRAGTHPLVRTSGVAAASGPLRCGDENRGTWTFDVTGAPEQLTLHYPGLAPIPVRVDG